MAWARQINNYAHNVAFGTSVQEALEGKYTVAWIEQHIADFTQVPDVDKHNAPLQDMAHFDGVDWENIQPEILE